MVKSIDELCIDSTQPRAEMLETPHGIGRGTTLVMAIACGVAAAPFGVNGTEPAA